MPMKNIHVEENLVFAQGGGRDLHLDLYMPADAQGPLPVVLMLHGGGWQRGNKSYMRESALAMAQHGFICMACEYRLNGESRWPAQIHDVKAAIRWVRANAASRGMDATQILCEGHSAGAHLALLAAATPGVAAFSGAGGHPGVDESVAGVAAVYPPVRFHMPGEKLSGATPVVSLIPEDASQEEAHAAGPIAYASAAFPPTLLLHGTVDKVVPPSASVNMYNVLVQAGAAVELHMLSGLPHGFARRPGFVERLQDEIAFFFKRTVVNPQTYAEALAAPLVAG
jgi:acetyl esterase/lipase